MPPTYGPSGKSNLTFVRLVERTTDALVTKDDGALDEVKKVLLQVHQQYDKVREEAERKQHRLNRLREEIRTADQGNANKGDATKKLDDTWASLEAQLKDVKKRNRETQTSRKVYEHMLQRIQREQAILKQKMFSMEEHFNRKKRELRQKRAEGERARTDRVQMARQLDAYSEEAAIERDACKVALENISGELDKRKDANRRRADFESWRHEVALDAANEAFNASAGRLRKMYAIEKLSGNFLQKTTFEQVERSQNTEDGFQQIRDVTGLADVMDIVHKFLNREVELEQLKVSVKDAELRLEALRHAYEAAKQKSSDVVGDDDSKASGYNDYERAEQSLNDAMEEFSACGVRLQKTTLQSEHMKRWAVRVGGMLSQFDEPARVEHPADLPAFFKKLEFAVRKFVARVQLQISEGKINRKTLQHMAMKEHQEYSRLLTDHTFLQNNCRVQIVMDDKQGKGQGGRPTSRGQGGSNGGEDDPATSFAEDRDRCKKDSQELSARVQAEQQKKRPKIPGGSS
eukprot:TRINITY_DN95047_c0_g1_i1.p1 TRINITY_DN95047_c0_g1~~TRINITY_DN95047_c0_g1_i1.p1  ORF type:complete len:517 (+),score=135.66 TRINITY_DN95047_c0_g1_i1:71-1621(+)